MGRKTPTKEQRQWIKDNGYTEKQIDAFWEDCRSTNPVVNAFSNNGGTWRDMSISVLKDLPTQKQRDIEYIKKKEQEEEKEKARLAKAEAEKKYYEDHFEEIVYNKICNKESLTKEESERLVCGDSRAEIIEENKSPDLNRWTQDIKTIIKIFDKYFAFQWQLDLTQYQENLYDLCPVEVTPHTYKKTITVTQWIPAGPYR
mgnify:CR=1 FL=1